MNMTLKIMEKEISLFQDIPIIIVTYIDVISYVKGYSHLQEKVHGEVEPNNLVDKYVASNKEDGKIVGHLPLRKNGKFAKTIFYFL